MLARSFTQKRKRRERCEQQAPKPKPSTRLLDNSEHRVIFFSLFQFALSDHTSRWGLQLREVLEHLFNILGPVVAAGKRAPAHQLPTLISAQYLVDSPILGAGSQPNART